MHLFDEPTLSPAAEACGLPAFETELWEMFLNLRTMTNIASLSFSIVSVSV